MPNLSLSDVLQIKETLMEDYIKDVLGRKRGYGTLDLLKTMENYPSGVFNPEGSGYDEKTVRRKKLYELPSYIDPYTQHGGSLDPYTGMVLKGIKGDTFHKTLETEEKNNAEIVKDIISGRYFARPRSKWRKQ